MSHSAIESAIYSGKVFHRRVQPKVHAFEYDIYLYWIKLSETALLHEQVGGFADKQLGRSIVNFTRSDYLGDAAESLEDAVLAKMSALHGNALEGDVFMLGQIRTFGIYFSPVNFYYLRNSDNQFTHMLAEVSNTPWNERHHYLVDLKVQADCPKAFHVSPFNPMDMTYHWRISQPDKFLRLQLTCSKEKTHFEASIDMEKIPLTTANLRKMLLSIPSMTLKTMAGIYWQALKLFVKRVPIYTHT